MPKLTSVLPDDPLTVDISNCTNLMKKISSELNTVDRAHAQGSFHIEPAILFVGRDPGLNEINEDRPFVGQAGQRLNESLAKAGLRRQDCNFTNRVGYKPWNNNFNMHKESTIVEGKWDLFALIRQLKPTLIVTLGNEATYDLVSEYRAKAGSHIRRAKGIMNYRGFFFYNEELKTWVMPSLHPSSVLYQPTNGFQFDLDISRAAKWIKGELPRQVMPEPKLIRAPSDMDKLYGHELVSFDIETTWGGSKLLVTAFCGDDFQPWYLRGNRKRLMRQWLSSSEPKLAHNGKFDSYFLNWREYMPVENLCHDTMALHWAMYPELAGKEDTGSEEKASKNNRITRKGLLFLASMYLNVNWWKSYTSDPDEMAQLCSQDVWVTKLLFDLMVPIAKRMGVWEQYLHNMALQPSLIATQQRGLGVDNDLRKDRIKLLTKRLGKTEKDVERAALDYIRSKDLSFFQHKKRCHCCNGNGSKCWRCTGFTEGMPSRKQDYLGVFTVRDLDNNTVAQLKDKFVTCRQCDGHGESESYKFNLRSATQVEELFFNELQVPKSLVVKSSFASQDTLRRVYEEWATVETSRKSLAARRSVATSILEHYFQAKKDGTIISAYKRLKPAPDGKIRQELSSYRVATSRLASSKSLTVRSTNLQNLTKNVAFEDPLYKLREVIIPDPGFVFLLADYEKAEAVIGAADSQDWTLYDKLIAGFDIHSEHSEIYFGEVTEMKRNICKEIQYGSNYLATAYTIQTRVNRNYFKTGTKITFIEADRLLNLHLERHPLEEWWKTVWEEGREANFWLENPFGLRRQFNHPDDHDRLKQMVNWRCQSTVASAVNASWLDIWNKLDYYGLHTLAHQVHDEIILHVREDLAAEVGAEVKQIMERKFMMRGREIYIPVAIEVAAENWATTEPLNV